MIEGIRPQFFQLMTTFHGNQPLKFGPHFCKAYLVKVAPRLGQPVIICSERSKGSLRHEKMKLEVLQSAAHYQFIDLTCFGIKI